jgi:hypothetical protein
MRSYRGRMSGPCGLRERSLAVETPKVGDVVGAKRWPYHGQHPETWQKPVAGEVLARDDVRAWVGTIAFPGTPDPSAVTEHVAVYANVLSSKVPVLWDFGEYRKVYWELTCCLRPYAEDVESWEQERTRCLRNG